MSDDKGIKKRMQNKTYESVEEIVGQDEIQETPTFQPNKIGVVANCNILNVRQSPTVTSEAITMIKLGTEVRVNESESTDAFYSIITMDGVGGFCMRKYIQVQ